MLLPCLLLSCSGDNDLYPIRESAASGGSLGGGREGSGGAPSATGGASVGAGGATGGLAGAVGTGGCQPGGDADGDGYSAGDGDCNDCNPAQNPGAFEVDGNGVDEDCSGVADDDVACDAELPEEGDAVAAARALGICRQTTADASGSTRSWGLVSARYVFPDGTTASLEADEAMECPDSQAAPNESSHGILANFGPQVWPRQGATFVALSSGVARASVQPVPGAWGLSPAGGFMCTRSWAPPGFPPETFTTCGDGLASMESEHSVYDGIALELVLRVPTNARSLGFDFNFYSYEYPEFVCSTVSDAFAAFLVTGASDAVRTQNITVDSDGNPFGVNNLLLEVCEPCSLGTHELEGTGFNGELDGVPNAATGWLRTRASVIPGSLITLRLAIWDAGSEWWDSTVLMDNFAWELDPHEPTTTRANLAP